MSAITNVEQIADRAKHWFAQGTNDLAALHYRLAELAGTGHLEPAELMRLQEYAVSVWEALYHGTVCAVRDENTPDETWPEADNTYGDDKLVLVQSRIEEPEHSDFVWEHNSFTLGDGAVAERPMGVIYGVNLPPEQA